MPRSLHSSSLSAALFALTLPLFATAAVVTVAAPAMARKESGEAHYKRIQSLEDESLKAIKDGKISDADRLSRQLLAANATTPKGEWYYGNAVYDGNQVQGQVALSRHDRAAARRFLLAAGDTPGSPQLDSFGPDLTLAAKLYDLGEHATVLRFLDRVGKFWGSPQNPQAKDPKFGGLIAQQIATLKHWKNQVKASQRPSFNCMDMVVVGAAKDSGNAPTADAATSDPTLLAKGTLAPDFTVNDPTGKPIHLSDYKGKVVILDFWATWCPPCQASLPHTNEVAHKFASRNVVVLAVCTSDTQKAFADWLPAHKSYDGITFAIDPSASDKDVAGSLYKVSGIPTQYVIGADGKIVTSFVGYNGPTDELSKAIQQSPGVTP